MPLIADSVSVAANSSSGNVLAGSPYEFVNQDSIVTLALTQPGAAPGDITMDFQIGGESLASQSQTPFKAPFPTFLDDTLIQAGARAGERLFLNLNNTTVGALVPQWMVRIDPL